MGKVEPLADDVLLYTLNAFYENDMNYSKAGQALGVGRMTIHYRIQIAKRRGLYKEKVQKPFASPILPSEKLPTNVLLERRKKEFEQKNIARNARKLIPVQIKIDGPIGILHMGDPHVDDDGCDIGMIERHVKIVNKTEGMFAANVGDFHNNWIGRLARLYAEQSTTAGEAWQLVEWLVKSTQWLYIVKGNHDLWTGSGDPLDWMIRGSGSGPLEDHGLRLELQFPNKKTCRINARHDFAGHSMWNTAHGPAKAVQMGWRDHILVCGHTHVSGYQLLKDPSTGLISHAIRAASYKIHDRYAIEKGLPDQNIFCAPVTIIDPSYNEDDSRFVHFVPDPEEAAAYLTFKRKRWTKS